MTRVAWLCLAVAVVAAGANWWSRAHHDRRTELWSKPLTLVALIGVAVALDPVDPVVRAWFVAALVLSLVGDVCLLFEDRLFLPGLAAFLLGHVAYVIGFVVAAPWEWWRFGVATALLVVAAVAIGRRVVAGAVRRDRGLGAPVAAYVLVISAMVACAAAVGPAIAVVGAVLFFVSDSVLGWRLFVDERSWMPVTVMVTYHLGQAALVLSLLG
ncbi:MAG: lysoplasmalogenase [Ilumatobacteraceae bacterium]|jgi:uncharacterized membrane protein YhhN|nr:lysoplasmalogenase [Ilumatobacteraceae bacterium]